MTGCVCPIAGWCDRHKVTKSKLLHEFCQTDPTFFQAWEDGKGPRQLSTPTEYDERRLRVIENVKRNQRLRGWVMSMRISGEAGIGDTLDRLIKLAGARAIKRELRCMQRACDCQVKDATAKLNEQYPY